MRNVRDFGAKGDGGADDTAAIQRAIEAGSGADGVRFPVGHYRVTRTLTVRAGVALIGDSTSEREVV